MRNMASFSVLAGAAALIAAVVHFWAGPIAPQRSLEVSIGESIADIGTAAVNKWRGQPQPPAKVPQKDADQILRTATGGVAALGLVLAAVGFVRKDPGRLVAAGAALSGSALLFQVISWLALVLIGVVLIAVLIDSVGDGIGGLFDFFSG